MEHCQPGSRRKLPTYRVGSRFGDLEHRADPDISFANESRHYAVGDRITAADITPSADGPARL